MSNQELNLQEIQEEEETSYAAMYHSAAAAHHHSNTTYESPEKYTTTTTTTYKRHSPSSFQEPSLKKKATLDPPSSPTTAAADYHLHGYTKLPLPHYFPIAALPPLRRTISEPLYSANTTINPPLQDFSDLNIVQESSSPSPHPKPPPPLHRTVSDPSPVANRQAIAASGTPPRPPLPRSASRSPICGESTNHETERMKRMKERLKEMNKWVNEFVNDVATENYKTDIIPKEEIESEIQVQEHETQQEAVWVDKDGECVILHLDCPCGNRYQILLHGSDCYYKLINVS
ncbi:hypothetical protein BUALT_Bualt12G0073300 [Buddleja alternifolia]|uniref:Uncharacterized protein n=1 Tax=Buddleja alternifolia TaxID=168488 RepID=A0AAV6WNC1_9LAMI|nr:hypothetical protein BUALT_Bualt12G0073300 [Buddleja alternifolia]